MLQHLGSTGNELIAPGPGQYAVPEGWEPPVGLQSKDPVNQPGLEVSQSIGPTRLGLLKNWEWYDDPRRLLFSMARAKFVAKMFAGRHQVLEVGCGDAFCAPIVRQSVARLTVSDFDPAYIEDARSRITDRWPYEAIVLDVTQDTPPGRYDGIYSLDMLEHIPAAEEAGVLHRLVSVLEPAGALIIGMPSLESQVYASAPSKAGHVNCKTEPQLRELMEQFFHNVFLFGMNDEVLHCGYGPMCHYRLALACMPRSV
jgi:2-polyprenyl-3-methyl-5-hydroxy-6-metoxy-1,4-benzoquinol methylase